MSINLQSNKIEKFSKIQGGLSYSVGEPNVSIKQLMNDDFIRQNTAFDNWENLLQAAQTTDEKDLSAPRFSEFINAHTRFEEWEEMLAQSSNEYALRHENDNLAQL